MLVLTRRVGEEIIIAGDIRVTLVSVQGERARIGITAPASIRVMRAEVRDRNLELQRAPAYAGTQEETIHAP
jgi:carbon storage regulator